MLTVTGQTIPKKPTSFMSRIPSTRKEMPSAPRPPIEDAPMLASEGTGQTKGIPT